MVPGVPHHITQRGNRRQRTFFGDDDYDTYVRLMAASCAEHGVEGWSLEGPTRDETKEVS